VQDAEEVAVADLVAQLVDGHGAPEVHGVVEQELGAGVADDHAPERVAGRRAGLPGGRLGEQVGVEASYIHSPSSVR